VPTYSLSAAYFATDEPPMGGYYFVFITLDQEDANKPDYNFYLHA
jgi:hypothetical protein